MAGRMRDTADDRLLARSQLRDRGWTPRLIAKFLGAPDAMKRNPHYAKAAPMRLYALARVEVAEQSADFASARAASARLVNGAKKAVGTKRDRLLRQIAEMQVSVAAHPLAEVRHFAIKSFNDHLSYTEQYTAESASEASEQAFLERIMVNYIRHELTNYDKQLEAAAGRVGVRDAVQAIRSKVFAAIAAAYPDLSHECDRQRAARERTPL